MGTYITPWALAGAGASLLGDVIAHYKRGTPLTSAKFRDNMLMVGAWVAPYLGSYNLMNSLIDVSTIAGKATRAVAELALMPIFVNLPRFTFDYVLRHKRLKGVYDNHLKPLWFKNEKDSFLYGSIPKMLTAWYLPAATHFPINLGIMAGIRAIVGSRQFREGRDPYRQQYADGSHIQEAYHKENGAMKLPSPQPA